MKTYSERDWRLFRKKLADWQENYMAIPTENQLNRIINLLMEASNNAHMWHNFGWTPTDLRKKMGNKAPKSVSFGPGIQKSFMDGTLDKNEVKKKLLEMGIDIVK